MVNPLSRLSLKSSIYQDYKQVWHMSTAAFLLSAATIIYYNYKWYNEQIANVISQFELATITLMPYMISAAVAAITTIGIREILPVLRSAKEARHIHGRLKQLAKGDLTIVSRLDCENEHLKDIAVQLNYAVGFMGSSLAQWKIINRQQWDLLENVRQATLREDHMRALKMIDKMEENWRMIADIEDRFKT